MIGAKRMSRSGPQPPDEEADGIPGGVLPPPCFKFLHLLSGEWTTTGVARNPSRGPCPDRENPFPPSENPTFFKSLMQFHHVPTMSDARETTAVLEYAQHAWRRPNPSTRTATPNSGGGWFGSWDLGRYFRPPTANRRRQPDPREEEAERDGLVHSNGFVKCVGPTRLQWAVTHSFLGTEVLEGDIGVEPDDSYSVELRSTWLSNARSVDETVHIVLMNPVGTQLKRRVFTAMAGQDHTKQLSLHLEEEATVKDKGYTFVAPDGDLGIPAMDATRGP